MGTRIVLSHNIYAIKAGCQGKKWTWPTPWGSALPRVSFPGSLNRFFLPGLAALCYNASIKIRRSRDLDPDSPYHASGALDGSRARVRVATAVDAPPEHPDTNGPIITDSCIPIEAHHASLQVLWALAVYTANFSQNWRAVSTKGNLYTFNMPVRFTYGLAKDLETYIIAPFIVNWVNNVDRSVAGPNGERSASYAGLGDITTVAKYLVLEEGEIRPAVSLVGGVTWPSGHASHLNPRFLVVGAADAVGTGAFTFTTGLNLGKWVKPFLLSSNVWLNSPINI